MASMVFSRYSSRQASIIVSKKDLFDYNHGEPPAEFTTILRILDVGFNPISSSGGRLFITVFVSSRMSS
jgi:hypothetical protein